MSRTGGTRTPDVLLAAALRNIDASSHLWETEAQMCKMASGSEAELAHDGTCVVFVNVSDFLANQVSPSVRVPLNVYFKYTVE